MEQTELIDLKKKKQSTAKIRGQSNLLATLGKPSLQIKFMENPTSIELNIVRNWLLKIEST